MKISIVLVIGVFGIVFGSTGPAYAYIDPGTGSILLQGLVGAVAAAGAAGILYWRRIKDFFGKKKDAEEEDTDRPS